MDADDEILFDVIIYNIYHQRLYMEYKQIFYASQKPDSRLRLHDGNRKRLLHG
jgi:hypothetical protein